MSKDVETLKAVEDLDFLLRLGRHVSSRCNDCYGRGVVTRGDNEVLCNCVVKSLMRERVKNARSKKVRS